MGDWAGLPLTDWIFLSGICFFAGLVRGFSGFALSAVIMASALAILPPVQLIPVLFFLELVAGLMMARGGWRDADRKAAITLVLGNMAGWPIGLWLTMTISVGASKTTVLITILVLAATQLARLRLPFLATQTGTILTGVTAGIVSGLAHVGGMIVALYALSRDSQSKVMRGTLVTFLFFSSIGSFFYQRWFGVMDQTSVLRAGILIFPTVFGVWLGQRLFTERLQPYYRPFCLWLLVGLALVSLIRHLA